MILYRGTNVEDNFLRCFDHFAINHLGVVNINVNLKVVLQCRIRTSNLSTEEKTPPHTWR